MFYEISCSRFLALWLLIFVLQNSLSTTGLEVNIDRHKNSWAVRMQRSATKEDVLSLSEKFGLKPDKVRIKTLSAAVELNVK